MNAKYSVTICNQSSLTQTYVASSGPPTINPAPPLTQTNVMFILLEVAGGGGQAYFTVPSTSLFAICGPFDGRSKHDVLQFEVLDSIPVKLGTREDVGTLIYRKICDMVVPHSFQCFRRHLQQRLQGVWVPSVLEQKGIPRSSRQLQVSQRSAYSFRKRSYPSRDVGRGVDFFSR